MHPTRLLRRSIRGLAGSLAAALAMSALMLLAGRLGLLGEYSPERVAE
jgi:hypothetical protein